MRPEDLLSAVTVPSWQRASMAATFASVRSIPRWLGVLGWAALFSLVYGALPIGISRLGRRHGWVRGKPGAVNLVGLVPLAAGAGAVIWTTALHYQEGEDGWSVTGKRLGQPPEYLLTRGPYAYTRNPMHLGTGAIWLGWAVILGSPVVASLLGAGAAGVIVLVPGWEERELENRFGDAWRAYRDQVPRWLRRRRTH